jgi:hypothetical protein
MFEPAPPVLNIVLSSANTIGISWFSPPTNFLLQQNTDLTTTNWTSVTDAVNSGSGSNQIALPVVSGSTFFRLVSH